MQKKIVLSVIHYSIHADIPVDSPLVQPQALRQHTEGCEEQESLDIKMGFLNHPQIHTEHEASLEVVGKHGANLKVEHPENVIIEKETGVLYYWYTVLKKNA